MGWFDEQLHQRMRQDDASFAEAFACMADAVMGQRLAQLMQDARTITQNSIGEILKYYHIKPLEIPDHIQSTADQLEYMMRPAGIMWRTVNLEDDWYRDAVGPMLGTLKSDGSAVALIPQGFSGYAFFDAKSGRKLRLSRKTAGMIDTQAICFYRAFPLKEIGMTDLLFHIAGIARPADYLLVGLVTLAVALIGMLPPYINKLIYARVIPGNSLHLLLAIFTFYICASLSQLLISTYKSLVLSRINSRMGISFQAAGMARMLSLPASFFKEYSAGDLSSRMGHLNSLCGMLVSTILSTGLSGVFSMVYISQMAHYGAGLVVPGLAVILVTVLAALVNIAVQLRRSRQQMQLGAKESGLTYSLVSGVQKIKLSGSEKRAFAKWASTYAASARLSYDLPLSLKLSRLLSTCISLVGTLVIYFFTIRTGVALADYYAFQSAYGMVTGAFLSLTGIVSSIAQIRPIMEIISPLLKAVPEVAENKLVVEKLSGGIELSSVSFRYQEDTPNVIDNLSLKISPGQYVAIVGKTGCGKSTLMRLLLGFETPQKGAVYYDGKDISSLDLKSLRRKMGVVTQNGKLFSGDIYSNITISAPWLTLDEAWEAAELSGIAQDIRDMPMGMHTVISEGSGGVSGGQRQRLMIARAIAGKPKILMFDEATSALDNLTQKKVSDSLDKLKCTRIVIAHRLSTIRQCDRILVLENGRIIEDGNYDELLHENGRFAELVARQRLDDSSYVGKTTLY